MSPPSAAGEAPNSPARVRIVLVSGLSGAGKASILRALEDIGYEAVDNPPLQMIDELVCARDGGRMRRIAIGVDARSRGFDSDEVLATMARLRANPALAPELVFAWADTAVLMRRFTETRRRHPLSAQGSARDGIAAEQALTAALHERADRLIDTTDLPLPALRQLIERHYGEQTAPGAARGLCISLLSFAFPAGLPRESDMVFDVRFLKNPHYVSGLKQKTGLDPDVGAFIEADPDFRPYFTGIVRLFDLLLPRFVQEGKKYVTIATGCTGGKHRSVYMTEKLAAHLSDAGWRATVAHRELDRAGIAVSAAQEIAGKVSGGRISALPHVQAQEA